MADEKMRHWPPQSYTSSSATAVGPRYFSIKPLRHRFNGVAITLIAAFLLFSTVLLWREAIVGFPSGKTGWGGIACLTIWSVLGNGFLLIGAAGSILTEERITSLDDHFVIGIHARGLLDDWSSAESKPIRLLGFLKPSKTIFKSDIDRVVIEEVPIRRRLLGRFAVFYLRSGERLQSNNRLNQETADELIQFLKREIPPK